nr:MAG TPA: hypothetical protein [Caudoviricetes sp.]DAN61671.1 MAG TPA: hypothetical protein [Caudoviricetes sp.]
MAVSYLITFSAVCVVCRCVYITAFNAVMQGVF